MAKSEKTTKTKKQSKSRRTKKDNYIYAVGRRKRAVARVRLYPNKNGDIVIDNKPIEEYFPGETLRKLYLLPLRTCNVIDKYLITVKVRGSGKMSQLGAVVHGISRALVNLDKEKFRPILKKRGFLTRDPRKRERRKVGMGGKARRKKQSPRR